MMRNMNNREWLWIKSKQTTATKTKKNLCTVQITSFMGPTWGPPGPCQPHVGPMILVIRELIHGICLLFPSDYLVSVFCNKADAFKPQSFASISLSTTDLIEAVPALNCPVSTSQRITPLCHWTLRHFPTQLNPWNITRFHGISSDIF